MGFNLHIKTAKIRDEIQPQIQTSKSEGVVPAWINFFTWNQPQMKDCGQLFLLQQPQVEKKTLCSQAALKTAAWSLFGLHSLMSCDLNTNIKLSHLRLHV